MDRTKTPTFRKLNESNCLVIYDEGEVVAVYEVKLNVKSIKDALDDDGYFNDYDENDWKDGIGEECCHSLDEVASVVLKDKNFFEDGGDRNFTLGFEFPSGLK